MGLIAPSKQSRYFYGSVYELEEGDLISVSPDEVNGLGLDDDIIHEVSGGDTLFAIAGKYFKGFSRPCGLYWVIADYQDRPIKDIMAPLDVGRLIRIPSRRTMSTVILSDERIDTPAKVLSGIDRG